MLLVLSGFLAAVLFNIATREPDSLAVTVPPDLWRLMGISLTSLLPVCVYLPLDWYLESRP